MQPLGQRFEDGRRRPPARFSWEVSRSVPHGKALAAGSSELHREKRGQSETELRIDWLTKFLSHWKHLGWRQTCLRQEFYQPVLVIHFFVWLAHTRSSSCSRVLAYQSEKNLSLRTFQRISMGLRSGEYGGKYSGLI